MGLWLVCVSCACVCVCVQTMIVYVDFQCMDVRLHGFIILIFLLNIFSFCHQVFVSICVRVCLSVCVCVCVWCGHVYAHGWIYWSHVLPGSLLLVCACTCAHTHAHKLCMREIVCIHTSRGVECLHTLSTDTRIWFQVNTHTRHIYGCILCLHVTCTSRCIHT